MDKTPVAGPKKQVLSEIDEHVLALLRKDVPLILGWDQEKSLYLIAAIDRAEDMAEDEAAFDQDEWLVYEVSDGLPGDRSASASYFTFDEANKAFDDAIERGRL